MKLNVGDVEINYEMIGEGKPILMLNGYFNSLKSWSSCMEPIFKDISNYKRIYVDHPGTGKSSSSPTIRTWEDMLEVLLKFIEEVIAEENFIIAGHSFGGFLARGILKRKFDFIDGMLLTCPVGQPNNNDRNIDKKLRYTLNISEERQRYIKGRMNRECIYSRKNTDRAFLKGLKENSMHLKNHYDDLVSLS